jgi:hypothetical protein
VFADVIELVDEQLESSQREIADVRGILADAVARLMRDRCDRGDGAIARSNASVDTVTALQFQDLSDQLLAHAMSRLDALRDEVRQVRGVLAKSHAANEDGWDWIATKIHRNLSAFAEHRNRPVATAHLAPGSVELF